MIRAFRNWPQKRSRESEELRHRRKREEAVAEGNRAVELLPISKDAMDGPGMMVVLAEIYIRVNEQEQAITLLEKLITTPAGISQIDLKDWNRDPLRNNPRFQKLMSGRRRRLSTTDQRGRSFSTC
jgi:hypothetical protein